MRNFCRKNDLNVLPGITFTRWAIIDILCKEGCRLNKTISLSLIWRSTISPTFNWAAVSFRLVYLQQLKSAAEQDSMHLEILNFQRFGINKAFRYTILSILNGFWFIKYLLLTTMYIYIYIYPWNYHKHTVDLFWTVLTAMKIPFFIYQYIDCININALNKAEKLAAT